MITVEKLAEIACEVGRHELGESMLPTLRGAFPGIHFSYCMDDDVGFESSALEGDGFNIYLVDASDHCLKLTRHLEAASGVVIAEVLDD